MDLEAIWQTHKPFIVKVGAGALVFAILGWYQSSVTAGAQRLERTSVSLEGDLVGKLNDLEGAEGLEKGRNTALAKDLRPSVLGVVGWTGDSEFALPKGDRPALFYAGAVQAAERRLLEAASTWNAEVPRNAQALGLPSEVEDAMVVETLARLDVSERVIRMLMDAGVRQVSGFVPQEVTYESPPGLGGHLRAIPFEVTFAGGPSVLGKVLRQLTEEGSFVEIVSCRVERTGDGPTAGVEVLLTAQALSLVDTIPEQATAKSTDSGRSRRGRRRGRRRAFGRR